jgi:hypothetical protein
LFISVYHGENALLGKPARKIISAHWEHVMKTKFFFLFVTLLSLVIMASCNLPDLNATPTPTSSPTMTPSIKNTAIIETTISETPSPIVIITNTFVVGDLGWGVIHGKVTDARTGAPIAGAKVTCWHSSYTSSALCNSSVVTAEDGTYAFPENFFHDTDRIQLEVESQGYTKQTINVNFFTSPWLNADFALVPTISTEPPQVMCTKPSCGPYDSLICPQEDCINGCGYVCITPVMICTPPLCAIGVSEVYYCPGVCPAGCGTICATFTPAP